MTTRGKSENNEGRWLGATLGGADLGNLTIGQKRHSEPDLSYAGNDEEEDFFEPTIVTGTPQGKPGVVVPERPAIEMELVRDELAVGRSATAGPQSIENWKAIEIWTKNRIYYLNAYLRCVEVLNRESGKVDANHALVGALLTGGQRRYRSSVHVTFPLPVPGTEAVFKKELPPGAPAPRRVPGLSGEAPRAVTSKVERVVYRVLLTTAVINPTEIDDVTSYHLKPRGK